MKKKNNRFLVTFSLLVLAIALNGCGVKALQSKENENGKNNTNEDVMSTYDYGETEDSDTDRISMLTPLISVTLESSDYEADYEEHFLIDMDGDDEEDSVNIFHYPAFGDEAPAATEVLITADDGKEYYCRRVYVIYDEQCHSYLFHHNKESLLAITFYFPEGDCGTMFVKLQDGNLMCAEQEGWILDYSDGIFYTKFESFSAENLSFEVSES